MRRCDGPWKKVFFVDEQWKFCDARRLPDELERIVRTGRFYELQYVSATHRPRDYHPKIRALVTEWIGFNTVEPDELDAVRPYFSDVDKVASLPRGSWISYFRDTREYFLDFQQPSQLLSDGGHYGRLVATRAAFEAMMFN